MNNRATELAMEALAKTIETTKQEYPDFRVMLLIKLHSLNTVALEAAETAELRAKFATIAAKNAYNETKIQIELLESELWCENEAKLKAPARQTETGSEFKNGGGNGETD